MFLRAFLTAISIGIAAGGCASPSASSPAPRAITAIDAAKEVAMANLCHAETIGYKQLVPQVDGDGNITVTPDWEQGPTENTNRPLDVAIVGQGLLIVKKDGQTYYTRDGNLFVNAHGQLTAGAHDGYVIEPPLSFPAHATDITISSAGQVDFLVPGQISRQQAGAFRLASFASPQGLKRVGANLYQQSESSGPPQIAEAGKHGMGTLEQGFLEGSNVNLVAESMRVQRLDQWRTTLAHAGTMPADLRDLARLDPGAATVKAHSAAGLSATASGRTVLAIDRARQVTRTNISNAETIGYKRARFVFDDAGLSGTQLNMEQGSMQSTHRSLDLAIEGPGFFRVKIEPGIGDGYGYTRCGNLFVNKDQQLVVGTGEGYRLDPQISIPSTATGVTLTAEGDVMYLVPGQVKLQSAGKLQLANFTNPNGLKVVHGTLLLETQAAGQAVLGAPGERGLGRLQQLCLEQSNVDIAVERDALHRLDEWRATLLAGMGLKSEP